MAVGNHWSDMFRGQLPRIYELRDLIRDPSSTDAYFQKFDKHIQDSTSARGIYDRWEKDFQFLDNDAWTFLKNEASPYLMQRDHSGRGCQQLYLSSRPTPGIELIFHNDRTPAYQALAMTNATVVNA